MILNIPYIVFDYPYISTDDIQIGDILIVTKISNCGQGVVGLIVNGKERILTSGYSCHFSIDETIEYLTPLNEKSLKQVINILEDQSNEIISRILKLDIMLASKDYN